MSNLTERAASERHAQTPAPRPAAPACRPKGGAH